MGKVNPIIVTHLVNLETFIAEAPSNRRIDFLYGRMLDNSRWQIYSIHNGSIVKYGRYHIDHIDFSRVQ